MTALSYNVRRPLLIVSTLTIAVAALAAQVQRDPSPDGSVSAQVLGHWGPPVPPSPQPSYTGGKWIDITFGRPIKRERELWGSGADYGKMLNSGAPVWRAGANVSTRLKTEVPLVVGAKTMPAGEYSLFIDLTPNAWTLIVSSWPAQASHDPNNKAALWGSFNYTPDRDVVRVRMKLETLPHSFETLSWQFLDMTNTSGTIALVWDRTLASVPFKVGGM